MSVENMIKSAIDNSPVDFKDQFNTIMADRVKDALTAKYNEMSAGAMEVEPAAEAEVSADIEPEVTPEVDQEV
jgi:hypothetical protein